MAISKSSVNVHTSWASTTLSILRSDHVPVHVPHLSLIRVDGMPIIGAGAANDCIAVTDDLILA
jgi:hypothetical protein